MRYKNPAIALNKLEEDEWIPYYPHSEEGKHSVVGYLAVYSQPGLETDGFSSILKNKNPSKFVGHILNTDYGLRNLEISSLRTIEMCEGLEAAKEFMNDLVKSETRWEPTPKEEITYLPDLIESAKTEPLYDLFDDTDDDIPTEELIESELFCEPCQVHGTVEAAVMIVQSTSGREWLLCSDHGKTFQMNHPDSDVKYIKLEAASG